MNDLLPEGKFYHIIYTMLESEPIEKWKTLFSGIFKEYGENNDFNADTFSKLCEPLTEENKLIPEKAINRIDAISYIMKCAIPDKRIMKFLNTLYNQAIG